jgi:transposase InsO family protein
VFYNRKRLHSTLDYMTPEEYDRAYWESSKSA